MDRRKALHKKFTRLFIYYIDVAYTHTALFMQRNFYFFTMT